jgi:hypothetical protein
MYLGICYLLIPSLAILPAELEPRNKKLYKRLKDRVAYCVDLRPDPVINGQQIILAMASLWQHLAS